MAIHARTALHGSLRLVVNRAPGPQPTLCTKLHRLAPSCHILWALALAMSPSVRGLRACTCSHDTAIREEATCQAATAAVSAHGLDHAQSEMLLRSSWGVVSVTIRLANAVLELTANLGRRSPKNWSKQRKPYPHVCPIEAQDCRAKKSLLPTTLVVVSSLVSVCTCVVRTPGMLHGHLALVGVENMLSVFVLCGQRCWGRVLGGGKVKDPSRISEGHPRPQTNTLEDLMRRCGGRT